jgi:hypothetical protein
VVLGGGGWVVRGFSPLVIHLVRVGSGNSSLSRRHSVHTVDSFTSNNYSFLRQDFHSQLFVLITLQLCIGVNHWSLFLITGLKRDEFCL